jgi:phosphate transport system permease protein
LVGLEVFVRAVGLGRSLASGALTLAMLALPIVIIAAREALRAVPHELREAGLALGATRWQMVWQVVLPVAAPGILTGIILATSRALGEAAPLLVLGAVVFVSDPPTGWSSPFTALPLQVFQWASRPQEAFAQAAAAGIVVLMVTLLMLNAAAIVLRDRARRRGA